MRCCEFYSGIGGFAAAAEQIGWQIVEALDINETAAQVYRGNFSLTPRVCSIESAAELIADLKAELWWMSPPCQPFTVRGSQRDAQDPRTASFLWLLDQIPRCRPNYLALENVPGFGESQTADQLRRTLLNCGYRWIECLLCPTELGIPNRRRRFYLVASRKMTPRLQPCAPGSSALHLRDFVDRVANPKLLVEESLAARYREAIHVVSVDDAGATTSCFTRAYGRSPVRSGSYLRTSGGLRRFSPAEILRLLGFPNSYQLPASLSLSAGWRLVGNSLSVPAVRHVLGALSS